MNGGDPMKKLAKILLALLMGSCLLCGLAGCKDDETTPPPTTQNPTTEPTEEPGPHTHAYEKTDEQAATCTEDGWITYTCSCGDSYTDVIPAEGHQFTETVVEATCTEAGYIEKVCSVCGETEREEISAKGHSYTETVVLPTCTEEGYTLHTCSVCGDSYKDDVVEATGHTIVVKRGQAATCGSLGWTDEKSCSVCGEIIEYSWPIAMLPHNFTSAQVTVVPTLTVEGSALLICANDASHTEVVVLPAINDGNYTLKNGEYTIEIEGIDISFAANVSTSTTDELLEILATPGATAKLESNMTLDAANLNGVLALADVKEYTIDLNGHELTISDSMNTVVVQSGKTLVMQNGSIVAENAVSTNANFNVATGASLVLDGVEINSTGSVLFPQGDAASVTVRNSTIRTTGVYAIGTNAATTDNYNVVITVENSVLETTAADGDAAAVLINVASTLNMTDVEVVAQRQGIVVRAGTATLKNVTVDATIQSVNKADEKYNPSKWTSGNEVAYGALVVGNPTVGSYLADAIVTIEGGSFICNTAEDSLLPFTAALYAYKGTSYKTEVTATNATFGGYIVNYGNTATLNGFDGATVITALIKTSADWANINQITATPNEDYYFLQIADVTAEKMLAKFCGTYNGNGYKLTRDYNEGETDCLINEINGATTIKNLDFYMADATSLILTADWDTDYGVTFENVTTNSLSGEVLSANSTNFGFFIVNALYTPANSSVRYVFKDCVNNVSVQNVGACTSVFIGSGPCANGELIIDYINCVNNGDISGTNFVGYFFGNPSYIGSMEQEEYPDSAINATNCVNNATISSVNDSGIACAAPKFSDKVPDSVLTGTGSFRTGNAIRDLAYSIHQDGTAFEIETDNAQYTYKLVLSVNAIYCTKDGSAWTDEHTADIPDRLLSEVSNGRRYLISLPIGTSASDDLSTFKAYDVRTAIAEGIITNADDLTFNAKGYALVADGGNTYMIFNLAEKYYVNSGVKLMLYAYEDNALVGVRNI